MNKRVLLIHGPNLNMLGSREPEKYGNKDAQAILKQLQKAFPRSEIDYFQSNLEGEIVDAVQKAGDKYDGILINAGAYAHTSVAIADAVKAIKIPSICIHITNTAKREHFRQSDPLAKACIGAVIGLGTDGYTLALDCLLEDHIKN